MRNKQGEIDRKCAGKTSGFRKCENPKIIVTAIVVILVVDYSIINNQ